MKEWKKQYDTDPDSVLLTVLRNEGDTDDEQEEEDSTVVDDDGKVTKKHVFDLEEDDEYKEVDQHWPVEKPKKQPTDQHQMEIDVGEIEPVRHHSNTIVAAPVEAQPLPVSTSAPNVTENKQQQTPNLLQSVEKLLQSNGFESTTQALPLPPNLDKHTLPEVDFDAIRKKMDMPSTLAFNVSNNRTPVSGETDGPRPLSCPEEIQTSNTYPLDQVIAYRRCSDLTRSYNETIFHPRPQIASVIPVLKQKTPQTRSVSASKGQIPVDAEIVPPPPPQSLAYVQPPAPLVSLPTFPVPSPHLRTQIPSVPGYNLEKQKEVPSFDASKSFLAGYQIEKPKDQPKTPSGDAALVNPSKKPMEILDSTPPSKKPENVIETTNLGRGYTNEEYSFLTVYLTKLLPSFDFIGQSDKVPCLLPFTTGLRESVEKEVKKICDGLCYGVHMAEDKVVHVIYSVDYKKNLTTCPLDVKKKELARLKSIIKIVAGNVLFNKCPKLLQLLCLHVDFVEQEIEKCSN